MTISAEKLIVAKYSGDGTTVAFTFGFRAFKTADLKVIKRSTSGVETVLVQNTDYTATLNGTGIGGTVTCTVAPATGETLAITREVAMTQELDLENQGAFFAEDHEKEFDKITAIAQDIAERDERTVRVPITSSQSAEQLINDLYQARDTATQKATEAEGSATTASEKASEVTTKYNLISPHFTAIDGVYADRANLDTVATNINNVNSVGTNIGAVNNVHSNMAVVTAVSGNATNINTVASDKTNIDKVATVYTKVDILANYTTEISTVSTNIANVNAVGSNIGNVNAVKANEANINAVKSNSSNINLVAGDKANIDAVAGDLANIDAASGHAAEAKKWAIGDPVEPTGGHSAKYYSEHMALSFKGAYSATTTYATNDFVSNDESSVRSFYVSLVDSNVGNPLSDTTKWAFLFSVTSGGSIAWGNITGEITAQTDLKNALDAKADSYSLATNEQIDAIPV